jgi:hypothetical protein
MANNTRLVPMQREGIDGQQAARNLATPTSKPK